mmetsp:Transcript_5815/g.9579  ORF Transcript_5815/g.9579 Transcript_5815/m.9579 type:complete len:364 (-) Transcript_5815:241-1332(-)
MRTAESRAVITLCVFPPRSHQVSACDAQTVNDCSSTERTHGVPSRLRVWFLKCVAGTARPRLANASRAETRRADGISCSSLISLGGAAIRRMRVCAAPNSAASSVAKATRPGKRAAYSASTSRVLGVLTFSRDHEWSPRASTRSSAQRTICSPSSTAAAPAEPQRAGERSVHGGEACTCKLVDGGGSSKGSPASPSLPSVTLALVLAAKSFSGTGSWSTPSTTEQPSTCRAPAAKPPRPQKRSTTSIPHPTDALHTLCVHRVAPYVAPRTRAAEHEELLSEARRGGGRTPSQSPAPLRTPRYPKGGASAQTSISARSVDADRSRTLAAVALAADSSPDHSVLLSVFTWAVVLFLSGRRMPLCL